MCRSVCRCTYTTLSRSDITHNDVRHTLRLKMAELSTLYLQRSTIFARTCTEREEFQANGEYTFSSTHTFNVIGSRMNLHRKNSHTQTHTHTMAHSRKLARVRHVRRMPPLLIANTRATFKKGLELLILHEYMPSLAYYI